MPNINSQIRAHHQSLKKCRQCPQMTGPPVHGKGEVSPVMLIGQAPGSREIDIGHPFAWTAGKTLFQWLAHIGLNELQVREYVFMTAVCRCFPGKGKTGDRVPDRMEMKNCSKWLAAELNLVQPRLLILVGKLSISRVIPVKKLTEVIGQQYRVNYHGHICDAVPLPHPSGISTWYRTEPGKTLLENALQTIAQHSAWQQLCRSLPLEHS